MQAPLTLVLSVAFSLLVAKPLVKNGAEPLVDFAIQLQKPWAVVPCCVFSHEFPGRKLANGAPVQSYEEFVQYVLRLF